MSLNPSLVDIAVMCRRLYEVLGNSFLVSAHVMIVVVIETATMFVFSAFFLALPDGPLVKALSIAIYKSFSNVKNCVHADTHAVNAFLQSPRRGEGHPGRRGYYADRGS